MTRPPQSSDESPEREYERLNPGAGGAPSQQEERGKRHPRVTRDPGGAALPGGSKADLHGPRRGKPQAGNV
ncbi:MAG: hypothetical protein U1E23_04385 [Reyranellaceae bacterium]